MSIELALVLAIIIGVNIFLYSDRYVEEQIEKRQKQIGSKIKSYEDKLKYEETIRIYGKWL